MLSNSSYVVLKYILHLSQLMPKEKSEYLKLLLFHLAIVHNKKNILCLLSYYGIRSFTSELGLENYCYCNYGVLEYCGFYFYP